MVNRDEAHDNDMQCMYINSIFALYFVRSRVQEENT